jgi:hypothetical protein
MQRGNQCPRCFKRTASRPVGCVACGAPVERKPAWWQGPVRRYGAMALTAVVALLVMAFTYADRYLPVLSDWYLEMVMPEVGDAALPLSAGTPLEEPVAEWADGEGRGL